MDVLRTMLVQSLNFIISGKVWISKKKTHTGWVMEFVMDKTKAILAIESAISKLESVKFKSFILEWSENYQKVGRITPDEEIKQLKDTLAWLNSSS